jgi:hypothetical protein
MSLAGVRSRLTIGVVILLAVACGGLEVIDGEVTSLVVRGVVEDPTGTPVAGAVVHVGWRPGFCDELQPFPPDTTGTDGVFEVVAWGWGTYSEACVGVRAEPPAGGSLQETRVQVDQVPLAPRDGPDTLAIRLTLTPS